ncbi:MULTISPECIES: gas vesicle protein GvpG [Streptomyces]|uniref:Gas vesicle protein GvpG n=1 Tax=Streptomyces mutomycini TaxID=284036 RepID=A0ABW0AZM1_9ACTN|nr:MULTISPECIES: gas vesicle protein GvpG [Streptomyces]KPC85017.1 gas vesicle protein [Streptomyces sp. NRRL S-4]
MGLISQLLTLPLAPVRGSVWVLDQVVLAAEREHYDPGAARTRLAELERELLSGNIDEEEFDRREDELLDWLAECEEYQKRLNDNS